MAGCDAIHTMLCPRENTVTATMAFGNNLIEQSLNIPGRRLSRKIVVLVRIP